MTVGAIVALCAVGTALAGACLLAARAVLAWAREVAALRLEIAALRLHLAEQRAADQIALRDLIRAEVHEHAARCPAREPTGVRAMPASQR